jgi:hypothetical protein
MLWTSASSCIEQKICQAFCQISFGKYAVQFSFVYSNRWENSFNVLLCWETIMFNEIIFVLIF